LLGFSEEKSDGAALELADIRWLVVETLGRSLFTTILIADLFMRVSLAVWRHGRLASEARCRNGRPDDEAFQSSVRAGQSSEN